MNITNTKPEPLSPSAFDFDACAIAMNGRALSADQSDGNFPVDLSKVYAYVKRLKLMMVDDEPANLLAVEKQLCGFGYNNFIKTPDSTTAISMMNREQPDLLLLDINMPQVSGLELLRQIRGSASWQGLPVLMLTACNDPATRRQALEAGCTDFLTKPIEPSELALRVRNVLVSRAFFDLLARRTDQLEKEVRQQTEALLAARHASELRYHAGKSEIAVDILHNVGNALNSVNVGVNLIAHNVRDSKVLSLQRAVNLLIENEGSLSRFLTKDERGRMLPSYLCNITAALLKDRDKMADELDLLAKHLEHINAVVASQQKHATLCNIADETSLPELLDEVDDLLGGTITKNGIAETRDYRNTPPIWTDRQKLLQVLVNIFKNAVESIKQQHPLGSGHLHVRLGSQDEQHVILEIQDNGVGISNENLAKLFTHGFTTKRSGHGFGLHSCANLIQELGGTIQALSDGVGKGAAFRLELPLKKKAN